MINIFNYLFPKYTIDKNKSLRLISLFSGYDSQKLGFDYLDIPIEHYRAIEFDKYAIQSLNEIHGTNFITNDITKITADDLGVVNTDKFTYLLTYSFPCTDLSTAGKKAGMEKGSGTRSGLLWEVERLLKESKEKCQVLIMENVPQVLTSKGWREWLLFLESLGYSNYVEVLNAKDYGIPQNRERCFMVSILGDYSYEFPKKIPLKIEQQDLLNNKVEIDEKYYLSKAMKKYIVSTSDLHHNSNTKINRDIAVTLNTRVGNCRTCESDYISDFLPKNFDLKLLDLEKLLNIPIRKKTPCECFKIMGVKPSDYNKLTCSNAQKYKQAGNSIVTTVLMAIYSQLFDNIDYEYYIDKLIEDLKE